MFGGFDSISTLNTFYCYLVLETRTCSWSWQIHCTCVPCLNTQITRSVVLCSCMGLILSCGKLHILPASTPRWDIYFRNYSLGIIRVTYLVIKVDKVHQYGSQDMCAYISSFSYLQVNVTLIDNYWWNFLILKFLWWIRFIWTSVLLFPNWASVECGVQSVTLWTWPL